MKYNAHVKIKLKPGVLDAEGRTVKKSLHLLGIEEVENVNSVKLFEIEINAEDEETARQCVEEACEKLLANPVIQTYEIELKEQK